MKKIIDKSKVIEALKQVDGMPINEKHIYNAIVNTHPISFCNYDNLPVEGFVSEGLEQIMKVDNFFVFVHLCTNSLVGFFYALKIIKINN